MCLCVGINIPSIITHILYFSEETMFHWRLSEGDRIRRLSRRRELRYYTKKEHENPREITQHDPLHPINRKKQSEQTNLWNPENISLPFNIYLVCVGKEETREVDSRSNRCLCLSFNMNLNYSSFNSLNSLWKELNILWNYDCN